MCIINGRYIKYLYERDVSELAACWMFKSLIAKLEAKIRIQHST